MYKSMLMAAATGLFLTAGAQAAPITVTTNYGPITTSPTKISAVDAAVAGSITQQGLASTSAARFNTNTGILTGVKITATAATASQTLTVTGSGGTSSGNKTASGTGSGKLTVTSSASSGVSGPVNIGSLSCDTNASNSVPGCPVSTTAGASVTAALNAPSASLANYVDGANYTVDVKGEATADLTQRTNFATASATYDLTLGDIGVAVQYSYYEHAIAALSADMIDFGTWYVGDTADELGLTISNGGGVNAANLSLISIAPTGDVEFFSAAFPTLTGLSGGGSVTSSWAFNTSVVGAYEALYSLTFDDVLPDGESGVGLRTYTKTVLLKGEVKARQVPEPGMLGLFGIGIAGIAFGRRRRAA